ALHGQRKARRTARERVPVGADEAGRLADANGGDGEVGPAQPQRGMAPDQREDARYQAPDCPGNQHRHSQGQLDAGGDEAADAEHGRMTEADLPEIAAEPVPGQCRGDPDEGEREEVVDVDVVVEERADGQERAGDQEPDRRAGPDPGRHSQFHPNTRCPKRPPGRTTSTSTSKTNPTAAVRYAGSARMANTSTAARMRAATAVPATLPRPPRTTTTNDLSSSVAPKSGLKENRVAASSPASAASAVPSPKVSA